MGITGTQTEKNMRAAFEGESKAMNKYAYYASLAKKAGNEEVAEMFERMCMNEREHAKLWFRILDEGKTDVIGSVEDAANGEYGEWTSMYPKFAAQARKEGLDFVASMFDKVAQIEAQHERQFREVLAKLTGKPVEEVVGSVPVSKHFIKKEMLRCMFCGNVIEGKADVCPVCEAIGSFEKVMVDVEA